MEFKEGLMILINLAILGTVIAAAVYVFQIGNKDRSVKCGAVDKFAQENVCTTANNPNTGNYGEPCKDAEINSWGDWSCPSENQIDSCKCIDPKAKKVKVGTGKLSQWNKDPMGGDFPSCAVDPDTGEVNNPCGGGKCYYDA